MQLRFLIAVLSLPLLASCGVNWVWDAPAQYHDLHGSVSLLDSSNMELSLDRSDVTIQIFDKSPIYNDAQVIATTKADVNGKWSVSDAPIGTHWITAAKAGYSRGDLQVDINGQWPADSVTLNLWQALHHSLLLDSIQPHGSGVSLYVFGRDANVPEVAWSQYGRYIVADTAPNIPLNARHVWAGRALDKATRSRPTGAMRVTSLDVGDLDLFSRTTVDSLYLRVYLFNEHEGDNSGSPPLTCGPPSNALILVR